MQNLNIETQASEMKLEYEIIVAVEDNRLQDLIESTLKEVGESCKVIATDLLLKGEYPQNYTILLEMDNLEKMKILAREFVEQQRLNKTVHNDNFDFWYWAKLPLKEEDVLSLYAIAGWDSTSIWGYQETDNDYYDLRIRLKRRFSDYGDHGIEGHLQRLFDRFNVFEETIPWSKIRIVEEKRRNYAETETDPEVEVTIEQYAERFDDLIHCGYDWVNMNASGPSGDNYIVRIELPRDRRLRPGSVASVNLSG